MEGISTAEAQLAKEKLPILKERQDQPKPTVVTQPVARAPEPKIEEAQKVDKAMKELEDKISVLKERGNGHFKKQAYKEAVKQFSEAINMYEAAGAPQSPAELKLKVTQVFTNRCLCFHHLNQQSSALSDANYVLEKLDTVNAKALFRRAHCYKTMQRWEDAMKDLQELYKENPSDEIKKDISECLKKIIEHKKQQQKSAEDDKQKQTQAKVEEAKK